MPDFDRYQFLQVSRDGPVLVITLNRPERLNAIHGPMHTELATIFRDANEDEDSRAVLLTGAGRGFCAGGDVRGMQERESSDSVLNVAFRTVRTEAQEIVHSMLDLLKPLVGAINGPAVGLGSTIALLCDVVIASERARIGDTHVAVGLVAGDGGCLIWPAIVGVNKAKELLMTGELITGDDLLRLGIVNHLVPEDDLPRAAMEMAQRLAGMAPFAARATKVTINKLLKERAETVLDVGLAWEAISARSADHREAIAAFMEKRPPTFHGR